MHILCMYVCMYIYIYIYVIVARTARSVQRRGHRAHGEGAARAAVLHEGLALDNLTRKATALSTLRSFCVHVCVCRHVIYVYTYIYIYTYISIHV